MGERRRAGRAPVLRRRRQAGEPIHIRSKRVRDRDASVRFLVILESRDERAAHGEPRAVERVAVLGAAAGGGAVADLGPARLERRAVRARRDLAVLPLPGQPDLHVVALRRLEPHVAGAVEHHPIGELEALEHRLGVPDHGLQLVVRLRGRRDLHQLDLVELVLSDHALHVLAVRPRLAAVARRERHVATRERRLGEDLTRVERRHGHLGGGDHVERAAFVGLERLEDLLLELGQEPIVLHRRGIHEVGHPHFRVAVLPRVEVEHELRQRALEPRRRAPQDRKSRLRNLRRTLEVEEPERFADLLVGLRSEPERARRSPPAHLHVLLLGRPGGQRRVGKVRDLEEETLDLSVDRADRGIELFDAIGARPHVVSDFGGNRPAGVLAGQFLRGTIVRGLQLFGFVDQAASLGVAGEEVLHQLGAAPVGQPARDRLGILTDQPEVQHGRYCASTGAELSASTRATEPTWSSGSSSMMRTPQVLRPCEETSAAWKRIILPLVVTTRMSSPSRTWRIVTTLPLRPPVLMSMIPLPPSSGPLAWRPPARGCENASSSVFSPLPCLVAKRPWPPAPKSRTGTHVATASPSPSDRRFTIAFPFAWRPPSGISWTLSQWTLPSAVKKRR